MKTNLQMFAVAAAIATSLLFGCSSEKITARTDPTAPSVTQVSQGYDTLGRKWGSDMITRSNSMVLNFTGTITDIDYANRELSLMDPQTRIETFVVDPEVQRF